MRMDWKAMAPQVKGFGVRFKQALRAPGPWIAYISGFGEHLPDLNSRMMLDESQVDRFGIPQVRFDSAYGKNEEAMAVDIAEQAELMLKSSRRNQCQWLYEWQRTGGCNP